MACRRGRPAHGQLQLLVGAGGGRRRRGVVSRCVVITRTLSPRVALHLKPREPK
jgi:hypothetical protein